MEHHLKHMYEDRNLTMVSEEPSTIFTSRLHTVKRNSSKNLRGSGFSTKNKFNFEILETERLKLLRKNSRKDRDGRRMSEKIHILPNFFKLNLLKRNKSSSNNSVELEGEGSEKTPMTKKSFFSISKQSDVDSNKLTDSIRSNNSKKKGFFVTNFNQIPSSIKPLNRSKKPEKKMETPIYSIKTLESINSISNDSESGHLFEELPGFPSSPKLRIDLLQNVKLDKKIQKKRILVEHIFVKLN